MEYSELFFSANEQLRLDDLIPLTKEIYINESKEYWDVMYKHLSFEEWNTLLDEHGYDIQKIKKNKNLRSIRQFFYVGDYSAVEIHGLDPSWLLNELTIRCLEADGHRKKDFLKKRYHEFFFPEWNTFALDFFIRLHKEIEEDKVWEVFKSLYIMANYGFHMIPEAVLEYVFNHAVNTQSISDLKSLGAIDSEGYIKVYRGEGERSTLLEKALSWTLSKEVAERFAHFYNKGKVYQAKVKAENIIDYNDERNEEEILVRFKDVEYLNIIQV